MRWHIYLDIDPKKWIFDVYQGRDITAGQYSLPPVIFSPEFEIVKTQDYVGSLIGYANYTLIGGQGEGIQREIVTVGSDDTGLDRHVIFVDARDIQNSADLASRGENILSQHKRSISFQSEILTKGPFEYQKDWDLGDIVTIQNKEWNLTMNSRVTEVTEIYEAGGYKLDVTFGNSIPTLAQRLKASYQEMKIESTR